MSRPLLYRLGYLAGRLLRRSRATLGMQTAGTPHPAKRSGSAAKNLLTFPELAQKMVDNLNRNAERSLRDERQRREAKKILEDLVERMRRRMS